MIYRETMSRSLDRRLCRLSGKGEGCEILLSGVAYQLPAA